jgi:glycosyltransferase involved in cell wall biosynthesis
MAMLTSVRSRTLFLISPFVPYPPSRGIELRIYRLLLWMKKEGYRVILIVPTDSIDPEALQKINAVTFAVHWTRPALRTRIGARFPRLRTLLWEPFKAVRKLAKSAPTTETKVISEPSDASERLSKAMHARKHLGDAQIKAWFAPEKLVKLLARLARRYRPHAIIVEYIFSAPVLAAVPAGTLKIIDTIDVFSRKEDQVLSYGIADPLACTEEEERRALLQADVIVAIQSREARLLRELVPEREVILAGMDLDVVSDSREIDIIPDSVVVVASDNALNVHGLAAFLSECWPLIKEAHSKATLHVVGKVGDVCHVEDPAIRYSGWVDDLDLVYREASVVINPTVAGTGLKIKSVQALAHGKPLVAWPNGVEGLNYDGEVPFRECRSWQEFASAVVLLLESDVDRRALAGQALAYAAREFGADKVYADLRACLENGHSDRWEDDGSGAEIVGRIHARG